ncbi:MAG: polysaccharide deacetylase family protein [Candidatus Omnitrophica bacterium]|nr:polysaccharide deacetylase family protein [Candidatus Omnitrophota bacterium]
MTKKILRFVTPLFAAVAVLAAVSFAVLPLPGTIPVLMYHFIDTPERAAEEKNVVSRQSFERQVKFLHRFGYRVLSMEQYEDIRAGRRKPRGREVVLTFDDGNYTVADQAIPILKPYQMPVTLFLVSGSLEEGLYGSMKKETILELARYPWITMASHSRTHPLLSTLNEEQILQELAGSKQELEALLNRPVRYFAYPSGNLDARVLRLAESAGYRLAFTTAAKQLKGLPETDFSITRVKISRTSDYLPLFWIKVSGIYEWGRGLIKSLKN